MDFSKEIPDQVVITAVPELLYCNAITGRDTTSSGISERQDKGPGPSTRSGVSTPGKEMRHDMVCVSIPLAGGKVFEGVLLTIDREDIYLFEMPIGPAEPTSTAVPAPNPACVSTF